MQVKIAPSILAADFGALSQAARECAEAGAECLHFDVMDGQFVPNITFGSHPIAALRSVSRARFEAHLMIVQPERFIDEIVRSGADLVTVQAEACIHLQRTLAQIRDAGAKAGLALNPATPLDHVEYVLNDIDLLLIMTVNPGFGGQEFIPATMGKIGQAKTILARSGRTIELEVDGGISPDNARAVVGQGANVLVAGTSIFHHPKGTAGGIEALRSSLNGK
jgi:ribulose-phosphate 3-epimerase